MLLPVEAGYTSASQVETFEKCERAWFLGSVMKERTPPSPSQAFGTVTHSRLEAYLLGHAWLTPPGVDQAHLDRILQAAIPHLPSPAARKFRVEGSIELPTYDGGPIWRGFVDLWEPDTHPPIVTDHKTTSNLRYAKTPQELAVNTQLVSYAKWAIGTIRTNVVRVKHLYLVTKGKAQAHPVHTDLTVDQINKGWGNILSTVKRMQPLRVLTDYNEVTPSGVDTGHCHAYGGCAYRNKCGIGPDQIINIGRKPKDPGNMSTLMEKLAAARAAQNGTAAPAPAPVATPVDIAEEAVGVVPPDAPPRSQAETVAAKPTEAERQAKLDADFPATDAPAAPAPKKRGRPRKNPEAAPVAAAPAARKDKATCPACRGWVGFNADGQFVDHRGVDTNFEPTGEMAPACCCSGDTEAEAQEWVDKRIVEIAATGVIPEKCQLQVGVAIRNKITERVVVPSKPTVPDVVEPDAAPPAERTRRRSEPMEMPLSASLATKREAEVQAAPGLTIYVDCLPTKGSNVGKFTMFEDWIAPIIRDASEANNVADYRMIPYTTKGVLATAINANRKAGNLPSVLVVMSHTGGADVALECLIPFASNVIRALRG